MVTSLPPPLVVLLGALLVPLLPRVVRKAWMLALPLVALVQLWLWPAGEGFALPFLGHTLELMRFDALSTPFAYLFGLGAVVGLIYALGNDDRLEQTATMLYVGSAFTVTLAGDLVTLFVGWELLAVTSVFLIWARRTPESTRAGLRYLTLQITSGLLLLTGILWHLHAGAAGDGAGAGASLAFGALDQIGGVFDPGRPAGLLILLAFGLKCGFPGLHTWIVDGYPAGTPTGSVFLSGFTTKVAIYAMARAFAGTEALIPVGTAMAVFPIFYAVIENDLRRVLGYSMINQLGFMVVGIGIGTDLAVNGAVAHAFNDVFFKGLLFMAMGAVLHRTGTINGSELGGLYKSMPLTAGLCCVGAASISAFPLFSGFVSKSMIMVAAAEQHFDVTWFLLLFAAAGVFHHAGIKIPYFAFFAHDSGRRVREAPRAMLAGMALAAGVCLFNGCYPGLLYRLLPFETGYWPYDMFHVVSQTQLLFFSALAFATLMLTGLYPPELRSVNLDFDWIWRRSGRFGMGLLTGPLVTLGGGIQRLVLEVAPSLVARWTWRREVRIWGKRVTFVEASVLLVMLMLVSFLLFNYYGSP